MLTTVIMYIQYLFSKCRQKVQHIVEHRTVLICYNSATLMLFHTQLMEDVHCTSQTRHTSKTKGKQLRCCIILQQCVKYYT